MAKSKKPDVGPPEIPVTEPEIDDFGKPIPEGFTKCEAVDNNTAIWHNVVYTLEKESIYTLPTDLFEFLNKSKMVRPVGV